MTNLLTPLLLMVRWPALLAVAFTMPVSEEIGLGLAVILTFIGMILHWQLPRQRMAFEEQMKDGTLTESQAKRRLKLLAISAPVATVAGVVMLLAILLRYTD